MSVFRFLDYKVFVNELIASLPKNGHGEFRRMALTLQVSTTLISQVFRGDKHLSLEMTADLCDYLHLNEGECQYFILLVEFAKSGSANLREKLLRRIREEQKRSLGLTEKLRLHEQKELTEEDKTIYYSSWMYAAIRNLSSIPDFQSAENLSRKLGLPVIQVRKVLDFLIAKNLVMESKGKLAFGPAWTHVPPRSMLTIKHHQNWRIHAFSRMVQSDEESLFFTGPMHMSREVADRIRIELPEFIARITKMVGPSDSEVVRCLNIDWFEF